MALVLACKCHLFRRYVVEEEKKENIDAVEPVCQKESTSSSKDFLQKVAGIFEENLRGTPMKERQKKDEAAANELLEPVYEALECAGLSTPVRRRPSNVNADSSGRFQCSTPRPSNVLGFSDGNRLGDMSTVSSIHSQDFAGTLPQKTLFKSTVVESLGDQLEVQGSDNSCSFLTCPEETEVVGSITSALASSKLSVSQELLHMDKTAKVSLVEHQKPSLLAIVQEDQVLLEQLQMNIGDGTSEKSALASISNLSSSIHSLSSSRVTYVLERSKNWGKEKEEVVELAGSYPEPLSTALTSIAVITRDWRALSALEEEMAKPFNNISDQAAQTVNLLTREKACKASFNYLLLDPNITRNLPLRVFSVSDQSLWRSFVKAVFYVGKGSRSRPFQHLYEAVKEKKSKKISAKILRIRSIWEAGGGVVVVQVFHNTLAVEAFTREAAIIDAIGCANLTNLKGGDYYGRTAGWLEEKKLRLGTFLLFKAFKIFLQEGERQIRPVDLRPS